MSVMCPCGEIDPRYEFCAPKYVDFLSLEGVDSGDDWFGEIDHTNHVPMPVGDTTAYKSQLFTNDAYEFVNDNTNSTLYETGSDKPSTAINTVSVVPTAKKRQRADLTHPITPSFMKRQRQNKKILSTEEQELLEIAEVQKHRKRRDIPTINSTVSTVPAAVRQIHTATNTLPRYSQSNPFAPLPQARAHTLPQHRKRTKTSEVTHQMRQKENIPHNTAAGVIKRTIHGKKQTPRWR